MSQPVLSIEDLVIDFKFASGRLRAVSEVSLKVDRGECLALVGESGCGKTLTSLSVPCLLPFPGVMTGGRVLLSGVDVGNLKAEELRSIRGREVGMIFQEPLTSLNPVFKVRRHLHEAISSHADLSKAEITARSVELLGEVGIPDPERRLDAYPHELSGGLRQRVMIACAIACSPALLIADEPTTALDVTVEAQIMRLLDELRHSRDMALLLVTHDLGLVAQHADRVTVMYAGFVVEEAPTLELFENPRHPYTRALLAAMPKGAAKERLHPIPGMVPPLGRLPQGCPFIDRCPVKIGECAQRTPGLTLIAENHCVRCLRGAGHA